MTTDITELAQREKFEAWWEREYKHLESSKYTDAVPHIKYGFWMAYQAGGAELVEALEKAQRYIERLREWNAGLAQESRERQKRIAELENYAEAEAVGADRAVEDSVYWMKRCKELGSRAVKLPDLRQSVSGDRYVWSDGVYNYHQDVKAALTAAGIKVEAE